MFPLQITALERARRIEELQKRLMDAEVVRTQYNRKVNILKDQVGPGGFKEQEADR